MAITSMDSLVAGLASGFRASFWKAALALSAANMWGSFWTAGGLPGAGATPPTGAGEAPTKDTAGALLFTNPSSGNSYLAGLDLEIATANASVLLYDRLVHTSGLSGTSTSAQTVSSAAITRPDANGANTELFIECYSNLGGTSVTATISYTNQSGTSGQSATATIPANTKAGQIIPVQLAAGDTGVRAVASVTLSATTGTAGNFGITIARRIAAMPSVLSNSGSVMDPFMLGLPQIYNGACLWLACFGNNSSAPGAIAGQARVAQG